MKRVLISLLGRGRLAESHNASSRPRYQRTTYEFPNGLRQSASFFGAAAFRAASKWGKPYDRWIILGTSGSSWAELSDELTTGDDDLLTELSDWDHRIQAASDLNAVQQPDLDAGTPHLRQALQAEGLSLKLIPYGRDSKEQNAIVRAAIEELEPEDRVTFAITHALRHFSTMLAFGLTGLRWFNGVTVENVIYGMLDQTNDGVTPVVDLTVCAELAEHAAAGASYRLTGRHEALDGVLPQVDEDLKRLTFLESLNHVKQAQNVAQRLHSKLHPDRLTDELASLPFGPHAAELARESMKWAVSGSNLQRMVERARFLRESRQTLTSVLVYYEAVLSIGEKVFQGQWKKTPNDRNAQKFDASCSLLKDIDGDVKALWMLRSLRNSMFHMLDTRTLRREIQQAYQSDSEMRKLLDRIDVAIEKLLSG